MKVTYTIQDKDFMPANLERRRVVEMRRVKLSELLHGAVRGVFDCFVMIGFVVFVMVVLYVLGVPITK